MRSCYSGRYLVARLKASVLLTACLSVAPGWTSVQYSESDLSEGCYEVTFSNSSEQPLTRVTWRPTLIASSDRNQSVSPHVPSRYRSAEGLMADNRSSPGLGIGTVTNSAYRHHEELAVDSQKLFATRFSGPEVYLTYGDGVIFSAMAESVV